MRAFADDRRDPKGGQGDVELREETQDEFDEGFTGV
jgi:hypothetical protein